MNLILAIFGGLLGLIVTGIAVYTAWMVHQLWKQQAASPRATSQTQIAAVYFSKWTVMDYAVVGLFLIGMLLLLVELLAIFRDKTAFESFHFAYLLSGIVFCAMGMLLLFVRLIVVLGFAHPRVSERAISPNHHDEPSHTDHTE